MDLDVTTKLLMAVVVPVITLVAFMSVAKTKKLRRHISDDNWCRPARPRMIETEARNLKISDLETKENKETYFSRSIVASRRPLQLEWKTGDSLR